MTFSTYPLKLFLALMLAVPFCAWAGQGLEFGGGRAPLPKGVTWALEPKSVQAAPGELLTLQVHGEIPKGYHTFSLKNYGENGPDPTRISPEPKELLAIEGQIDQPKPVTVFDENFGLKVETYEGAVTFKLPMRVSHAALAGEHHPFISVTSHICNEKVCLLDTAVQLEFTLSVKGSVVNSAPTPGAGETPVISMPTANTESHARNSIEQAKQNGLGAFLWTAFTLGAAALLTPCVFPMIPITVSFFTKRREESRLHAVRDASIYSIGIILTFVGLGFFFALLLGQNVRDFATNPWLNLAIAGIFLAMAVNLLGYYHVQMPSFIVNHLHKRSGEGTGIVSLLLMGLVFTLTSFTCTMPFVGTVMLWAVHGEWQWPLLGMTVFATVFAAPFFVLALFPALLSSLPKSGGWLNAVKVVMGFLEIAAALKFVSNADLVWHWGLLTRNVFLLLWIALALLAAVYLFGLIRFPHDTPVKRLGLRRKLATAGFLGIAVLLGTGLFGARLGAMDAYLPPLRDDWLHDYASGLAESRRTGSPLFLDFTGYTCTNCRAMESGVFPDNRVAAELKNFVLVRLHTDGRKDDTEIAESRRNQKLLEERYGTAALPFYAILTPDEKPIAEFAGLASADEFLNFLKSGWAKTGRRQLVGGTASAAK